MGELPAGSVLRQVLYLAGRWRHAWGPRDWSSDVCSSDLAGLGAGAGGAPGTGPEPRPPGDEERMTDSTDDATGPESTKSQIGRASCRETAGSPGGGEAVGEDDQRSRGRGGRLV